MSEDKYRENAIRYMLRDADDWYRDAMLSGEKEPHPVHEQPIIEAHIAGAHSRDEEVAKLENALRNVNEYCHRLRNKVYELRKGKKV